MPIINMPLDTLLRIVNRDGDVIAAKDVPDTLHDMGVEVEELATIQQFVCDVCGKVIERTEAQGAPLSCSNCGTDYRERADAYQPLGAAQVLRLDMLAVRPDIFDPGGMARYMRGFLGVQTGLVEYAVAPPTLTVQVDPRLSEESSYRPHIACAVLRNVRLDHDRIKLLMNLQEGLHWALGRDRKLASIGVYDLDTLALDQPLRYEAVEPGALRFVPLGFSPGDPASALTPAEILEKHKTGVAYAHLLKPFSAYPLLRDGRGTVLSMPPIINSEVTRVTQATKRFFIDVTGLSLRTIERTLSTLVTSLQDVLPEVTVEAVTIDDPAGRRVTPDLSPQAMTLTLSEAADTIGVALPMERLVALLERMGHGVERRDDDTLSVRVPAWRNDVMHPVDLIEDAAIAFGYQNLEPRLVPTFTVGAAQPMEETAAIARRVMTGLGFHQVMTLPLTSEPAAFEKWSVEPDPWTVRIANPISVAQTICRVSLLPGILETLAMNKQYDLPQRLFEVGDVCLADDSAETGAREERHLAAAMIGTHVGYADIRAVADALTHELTGAAAGGADTAARYAPIEHASYIPGRVASLRDAAGGPIGVLGELHPQVLENYGLRHPVVAIELVVARLAGSGTEP